MRRLVYILVMFLISGVWFTSCRSIKYVPVETLRIEYKTRDSIRFDSIYNRDSIYVLVKGDTVCQYKFKYLYKYQYLNRTDTVIRVDSVQVPYPVEKQLSRWQSIKMEVGGWAFGLVIAFILVIIGRFIFKFKNW